MFPAIMTTTVAVALCSELLPGFDVDSIAIAFLFSLAIVLLRETAVPLTKALAFPLMVLTLGVIGPFIYFAFFMLASNIPGVEVSSILSAAIASIVTSITAIPSH